MQCPVPRPVGAVDVLPRTLKAGAASDTLGTCLGVRKIHLVKLRTSFSVHSLYVLAVSDHATWWLEVWFSAVHAMFVKSGT